MELNKRDNTIDIAKGITIFLMVLGHNIFNSIISEKIYIFHMPLFFFLSGFFIKKEPFVEFVQNKIKRLILPFIFYWLFIRIWNCIFIFITNGLSADAIKDYINSERFFPNSGSLWFLISLFSVCVVSYFLIFKIRTLYVIVILILFNIIAYTLPNVQGVFPLYYGQSMLVLPFFVFGYWFYNVNKNNSLYKYLISLSSTYIIFLIFLTFLLLLFIPWENLDISVQMWSNPISLYGGAFCGILLILLFSSYISKKIRLLSNLFSLWGKESLHILGYHEPIMFLLWYFAIPIYIRVAPYIGFEILQGYEIRQNVYWLVYIVSILTTIICSHIGKYTENKYPHFFGINKGYKI